MSNLEWLHSALDQIYRESMEAWATRRFPLPHVTISVNGVEKPIRGIRIEPYHVVLHDEEP